MWLPKMEKTTRGQIHPILEKRGISCASRWDCERHETGYISSRLPTFHAYKKIRPYHKAGFWQNIYGLAHRIGQKPTLPL